MSQKKIEDMPEKTHVVDDDLFFMRKSNGSGYKKVKKVNIEKGDADFGSGSGQVATWAEGDNTDEVSRVKIGAGFGYSGTKPYIGTDGDTTTLSRITVDYDDLSIQPLKTKEQTVTATSSGTRSNVVNSGENEKMKIYLDDTFIAGTADAQDFIYEYTNTSLATDIVAGNKVDRLQIKGDYFSNLSGDITLNLLTADQYTVVSGDTIRNVFLGVGAALDGSTYTSGDHSFTFSWDSTDNQLSVSGLSGTIVSSQSWAEVWSSSGSSIDDDLWSASLGTVHQEGSTGNAFSITIDPDTSNTVYASDDILTSFEAETDESAADYLDRIGDALAALDTDITYDGTVNDGDEDVFYLEATYETSTLNWGVNELQFNTSSYGLNSGEITGSTSWSDLVNAYMFFGRAYGDDLWYFKEIVDVTNKNKIYVKKGSASATLTVNAYNEGNEARYTISAVDDAVGTPSFNDGDSLEIGFAYTPKYIEIDLGTKTDINHSMTVSNNDGFSAYTNLQGLNGVAANSVKTTYKVTDYDGRQITSFTSSVTASTETDLTDVLDSIVEAINDNNETPVDFTASHDDEDAIFKSLPYSELSGDWKIEVDNGGYTGDNAGDISFAISKSESNILGLSGDPLVTNDEVGPMELFNTTRDIEDNTDVSEIIACGKNSDNYKKKYLSIKTIVEDVTSGTEDAKVVISQQVGGELTNVITFSKDGVFLDYDGMPSTEPDTEGMLWRDSSDSDKLKVYLGL